MDSKKQSGNRWVEQERARRIIGFIGGYLIDDGALRLEDLDRGLEMQLRLAAQGRQARLGEVLIEMGIITREQLARALKRQAHEESDALKRAAEEQRQA
ncbi:MAG: hypothetical protein HY782_03560 [Chloroflexi bacterium]|nr:hypothetical protein [Chloroflexota bacterium]